jgi:hypothetical protein
MSALDTVFHRLGHELRPPGVDRGHDLRRVQPIQRNGIARGMGLRRAGVAVRHHRQAGRRAGELNTPDGFDLLLPDGSTPTHPMTGLVRYAGWLDFPAWHRGTGSSARSGTCRLPTSATLLLAVEAARPVN